MILMIDNYDSFTYNLVQYLRQLTTEVVVRRNDEIDIAGIEALAPKALVVSPGPSNPGNAGVSVAAIEHFHGKLPVLGVCLGHQCIGAAIGSEVVHAKAIFHGKTSQVHHDNQGVFKGLPDPVQVMRYHSLAIRRETLPEDWMISAETDDGEIMGIRHRKHPTEGVQFHPESIMTPTGKRMLRNFLKLAGING
ncbi:MAG: anthranilate synthase component II [Planctomycetota bacterium]